MAKRVIDLLEVDEIQDQECQRATVSVMHLNGLVKTVLEQRAIGKAGEHIVQREMCQGILGLLLFRDIGADLENRGGSITPSPLERPSARHDDASAITGSPDQLPLPPPCFLHPCLDLGEGLWVLGPEQFRRD